MLYLHSFPFSEEPSIFLIFLYHSKIDNQAYFHFLYFIIYNIIVEIFLNNDKYNFLNKGFSPLWLIILYIFGAYIGKYIFFKNFEIIFRFLICTICLIIYIFISVISYNIGIKNSYPNINTEFKRLFETYINYLLQNY